MQLARCSKRFLLLALLSFNATANPNWLSDAQLQAAQKQDAQAFPKIMGATSRPGLRHRRVGLSRLPSTDVHLWLRDGP